jgi:hypothetical protein
MASRRTITLSTGDTNYNQQNITDPWRPSRRRVLPQQGHKFADITDGLSASILVAEVLEVQADLVTWWGRLRSSPTYLPPNSTIPDQMHRKPGANGCRNGAGTRPPRQTRASWRRQPAHGWGRHPWMGVRFVSRPSPSTPGGDSVPSRRERRSVTSDRSLNDRAYGQIQRWRTAGRRFLRRSADSADTAITGSLVSDGDRRPSP